MKKESAIPTPAGVRIRSNRRIAWWGWLLRGVGCLLAAVLLAVAGLAAYYFIVVAPQERARKTEAERKVAAFARLTGPARRLAIYDALVAAIDEHYFDRSFAGFDWPRLKREWRSKAAAAEDDNQLYFDVFLPMTQAFPVSHILALPPSGRQKPKYGHAQAVPAYSEDDIGAQFFVFLRRGKRVNGVVGEVLPNSVAAKAGVQPGSMIEKAKLEFDGKGGGHISAKLLCLTPAESHDWEIAAKATNIPLNVNACSAPPTRRMSVSYDFRHGEARSDVVIRRLPGGALYIRFDAFQDPMLDKVIAALKTADARGVVIDLRFNQGGYVDRMVDALFPAAEPLYRIRDTHGLRLMSAPRMGFRYLGPITILTGPASASAAEVTAAVVKLKHRGLLVGRATSGSVLGSGFFDLPDGGNVQIPVQSIEMLDGQQLEGVGVSPDIEVYPKLAVLRAAAVFT